jgi:Na+/melibiose symporter-like transporter
LKELHLDPSQLGYLFTAMAVGSVAAAVWIMARARLSPNKLTFYANTLLVLDLFLMTVVNRPYVFLLVAALGVRGGRSRQLNSGLPPSAPCPIGPVDA